MFVADATKIVAVVKFFVAETGRIGRTVVSETATKVWSHWGGFCIWEVAKKGAKGRVDGDKSVAGAGFSRAESGRTGRTVVSEPARKIWSHSWSVDVDFGGETRVLAAGTGAGAVGKPVSVHGPRGSVENWFLPFIFAHFRPNPLIFAFGHEVRGSG